MPTKSDSSSMMVAIAACLGLMLAVAGAYRAYQMGYLDPYMEKIAIYFFKAKAMAEKKKLQAQGMKAGEDFVDSQLEGVQQANEIKSGIGALGGGLKKNL